MRPKKGTYIESILKIFLSDTEFRNNLKATNFHDFFLYQSYFLDEKNPNKDKRTILDSFCSIKKWQFVFRENMWSACFSADM